MGRVYSDDARKIAIIGIAVGKNGTSETLCTRIDDALN